MIVAGVPAALGSHLFPDTDDHGPVRDFSLAHLLYSTKECDLDAFCADLNNGAFAVSKTRWPALCVCRLENESTCTILHRPVPSPPRGH